VGRGGEVEGGAVGGVLLNYIVAFLACGEVVLGWRIVLSGEVILG
jgi:hypothetical protein